MICSRCKKYPAVVFLSQGKDKCAQSGICIKCAKELGIKPVVDLIDKMGISDDDIDLVQDQLSEFMKAGGMDTETLELNDDTPNILKDLFMPNDFSSSFEDEPKDNQPKDKDKSKKKSKKSKRKNIDSYCLDLTRRAREGKLDKIIGRDKEIGRVIQILSRRSKNNPCLIGEPGVGKTAIAEGLALKIAEGNVPTRLMDKEIHLLDLTSLVAGTQFRGQFESRIKGLIEEIKEDSNIILFIDEVHNLVGTGDSEGTMNAANILKPALSRGEIQVIGATTFSEYRKYIEKDSALERRFQPVTVAEPSVNETITVLKGIKSYYEDYHKVKLTDGLISRAVVLSERYITDRFLPDKAIDLIDEACACASLRNVKRDKYESLLKKINSIKRKEDDITALEEKTDQDYKELAQARYEIANLEKEAEMDSKDALKDNYVTDSDLARVIELWTGIPSSKIQENQLAKLAHMELALSNKIKGQDEAIEAIASAIRRSRIQISPRRRPASFIFVGPTGVGKTELVKVFANELFDTPETLIRLDMSEFMEKHAVSKIIGSPPGYVGYDEAGQVTEKVRRKPYSVILFDEIEKAHPDVMNILLQILDEGRITDSHGRVVNFENTVIIMTSNAGSNKKDNAMGFAKSEFEMSKEKAMNALSEFLRPEFLSRVDDIIVFKHLDKDNFKEIAKLLLDEYKEVLKERDIELSYDDEVLEYLAQKSIGGKSGARDLRNTIRKEVEDKIATILVNEGDSCIKEMKISVENGIKITI